MIGKRETLPGIVRREAERAARRVAKPGVTGTTPMVVSRGATRPPVTDDSLGAHLEDVENPHQTTAEQVGADPAGTAAAAVSAHNGDAEAHAGLFENVGAVVIGAHNADLAAHPSLFGAALAHAGAQVVTGIYSIVGVSNIVGLWLLNQTGDTTLIPDKGPNGYDGVLTSNASALDPGVTGMARHLSLPGLERLDMGDRAEFSFGNGTDDTPFSVVAVSRMDTMGVARRLLAKYEASGTTAREWVLQILNTNILAMRCYDESTSGVIGRQFTMPLTAGVHVMGGTKSSGTTAAAIKVYLDGVRVDDADYNSGSYTAMENTSAALYPRGLENAALFLLCSIELTAAQMRALYVLLAGYAGVSG